MGIGGVGGIGGHDYIPPEKGIKELRSNWEQPTGDFKKDMETAKLS